MVVNKTRQTPAQKRANAKFASKQEKKMGKPRPAEVEDKFVLPISKTWLREYMAMGGFWAGQATVVVFLSFGDGVWRGMTWDV